MSATDLPSYPPIGLFGPLRFLVRVVTMSALLLVFTPLHYLWVVFGRSSPWPSLFLAAVAWICGMRARIDGLARKHDVFLVSNHVSWLDIPIIGGATGSAFIAQDSVARWPLVGWMARINETIFIARSDRLGVAGQIEMVKTAIAERRPVTIFPEGTTTDGTSLHPFKPPLFAVLAPPPRGICVQPVLLDYHGLGPEFAWIGTEGAPRNAWRVLCRRKSIPVTLRFLEPFDPALCDGRKAIAATARERIRHALSASLGGRPVL